MKCAQIEEQSGSFLGSVTNQLVAMEKSRSFAECSPYPALFLNASFQTVYANKPARELLESRFGEDGPCRAFADYWAADSRCEIQERIMPELCAGRAVEFRGTLSAGNTHGPMRVEAAAYQTDVTDSSEALCYVCLLKELDDDATRQRSYNSLISSAARKLLESDAGEDAVHELFALIRDILPADVLVNYSLDRGASVMRLEAYEGVDETIAAEYSELPVGIAVCGQVALTGEALCLSFVQEMTDERTAVLRRCGIRAFASNPLIAENRVIGTLSYGSTTVNSFSDDEVELLRTLSGFVASAKARDEANSAIAESEARFRMALAGSPVVLYTTDKDLRVTWAYNSRRFALDDAIGKRPDELVPGEGSEQVVALLRRVLESGAGERAEISFVSPGDQLRIKQVTVEPLLDRHGDKDGLRVASVDVTNERRKQRQLEEAHARLAAHVQNSPLGVLECDQDFLITRWSGQAEFMFGYTPDDVIGRSVLEIPLIHPDDRQAVRAGLESIGPHGLRNIVGSNRNVTKDGRVLYCDWYTSVILSAAGEVESLLSLALDVTVAKKREEQLLLAKLRTEGSLLAGEVSAWSWDVENGVVFGDANLAPMLGIADAGDSPSSLEKCLEAIHPEDRERLQAVLTESVSTASKYECEFRLIVNDETRWVVGRGRPEVGECGRVVRLVGVMVDITERHQRNEELEALTEELNELIAAVPADVLIQLDPDGNEMRASRRACESLRLPYGTNPSATGPNGQWPSDYKILERGVELSGPEMPLQRAARLNQELNNLELEVRLSDDKALHFFGNSRPLRRPDGTARGSIAAFVDVTELKITQSELAKLNEELEERVKKRTSELEAAVSELEGFSHSVAHDLRAPLRNIIGRTSILTREYAQEMSSEALEQLQGIDRGARSLAQLINDLLEFSRLSRRPVDRKDVDLSSIAAGVLEGLAPEVKNRGRVTITPGLRAFCDGQLVSMVLSNLLENALKYSRGDRPNCVRLGYVQTGHGGAFAVKDTGIGMDMRYADRVFLPFERLHRSSEYPGSGIGLANVRRIVERHGGKVWIESVPDEGTIVYFTLSAPL